MHRNLAQEYLYNFYFGHFTFIIGLTKTDLTSPLSTTIKTRMVNIPEHVDKICVHTGNILNLNEVKKNAGQNSSEEVKLNLR